jgi:lipid A 3-O-deacylase
MAWMSLHKGPGRAAVLVTLVMLLFGSPAAARSIIAVEHDNDLLAFRGVDRDRWYTSGLKLSWSTDRADPPRWLRAVGRVVPFFEPQSTSAWGWSLQQRMYTPDEIANPRLPPEDRPYAGWLNVQFSMANFDDRSAERFSFGLGVVGPAALGEQTQKLVHRITGGNDPVGWETQLANEPTLLLGYERQWRVGTTSAAVAGFRSDWRLRAAGTISNAVTQLETGFFWRGGENLPDDFGPASISVLPSAAGYFRSSAERGWYLTIGANARLSAHDLFLDGSAFRRSPAVKREPFVAEVFFGYVYYWQNLRFSYLFARRSVEFRQQDTFQDFGSITVSWAY